MSEKQFHLNKQGIPMVFKEVETVEDAHSLRNQMFKSGVYPIMSLCEAAGINQGWPDGVCSVYKDDPSECTCPPEHQKEFEESLTPPDTEGDNNK